MESEIVVIWNTNDVNISHNSKSLVPENAHVILGVLTLSPLLI